MQTMYYDFLNHAIVIKTALEFTGVIIRILSTCISDIP